MTSIEDSPVIVPQRVARQLERMQEVLRLQTEELNRLIEDNQKLKIENQLLLDIRDGESAATMFSQLSAVLKEKQQIELELQAMKSKLETLQSAHDDYKKVVEHYNSTPKKSMESPAKAERNDFLSRSRKKNAREESFLKANDSTVSTSPNKSLHKELEKEQRYSRSVLKDLDQCRKLVLDRDSRMAELKQLLVKEKREGMRLMDLIAAAEMTIAGEKQRSEALNNMVAQMDVHIRQLQEECIRLQNSHTMTEDRLRQLSITNLSLNAKLDAQGKDLIRTKAALKESLPEKS